MTASALSHDSIVYVARYLLQRNQPLHGVFAIASASASAFASDIEQCSSAERERERERESVCELGSG